jgi:CelD/BcsL family acetyltransferase involved in cellulose biosynthesis
MDEALALLDTMDAQQHDRMKQLGLRFVLDDDCHARFYRDMVKRGLSEGYAILSALTCDEEVVATTLGIRRGADYILLRISNAGKRWSNCSPGLLVVERTMAALHEDGVRQFDLSIGNYSYKRRFGAAQLPLADVSVALGWRGLPHMLRDYAAQRLRRGCMAGYAALSADCDREKTNSAAIVARPAAERDRFGPRTIESRNARNG